MRLCGGRILNGDFRTEKKDITVKNGKITFEADGSEALDISGLTVIPGLIDIHIHGFTGVNVNEATEDELQKMSRELLKRGTTSFLATTTTHTREQLLYSLTNTKTVMEKGCEGAEILGMNMEGPYISREFKGAMREKDVRPFDPEEFEEFCGASGGNIRIMTLAPEIEENFNIGIEALKERNVVASVGHTGAKAERVERAIAKGMSHATHLFNAMRGIHHRDAGVVGAIFDSAATAELICDGFHISEKVIRIAYRILGNERLILISDAVTLAGMPDGEYVVDGMTTIIRDGTCTLQNGTINGNVNPLFECVRRCVKRFGIPFEDAVRCATLNPAKRIGVDDRKGSIEEGKDADLLVIDEHFDLKYVIKNGRIVKL